MDTFKVSSFRMDGVNFLNVPYSLFDVVVEEFIFSLSAAITPGIDDEKTLQIHNDVTPKS